MHSTVFVSGLVFATYFCWRLALVSFPLVLLLIIPGLIYGKYLLYLSRQSRHEYAKANSLVEQALGSIKTVYSFTAEKRIIQNYTAILDKTIKLGIKQVVEGYMLLGFHSSWVACMFLVYSLCFTDFMTPFDHVEIEA